MQYWLGMNIRFYLSCNQGCHGQEKKSRKWKYFQGREKSGKFIFSQENLEKMKKWGKSQGI